MKPDPSCRGSRVRCAQVCGDLPTLSLLALILTWTISDGSRSLSAQPGPDSKVLLNDLPENRAQGLFVQFSERWFDATCLGQLTEAMARRQCRETLDLRIHLATQSAALDPVQVSKLQAAGRADIHRFFAAYQSLKRRFSFGPIPVGEWHARAADVRSSGAAFTEQLRAGLHRQGSLYAKAINHYVPESDRPTIHQTYQSHARNRYAGEIHDALPQIFGPTIDRPVAPQPIETLDQRRTGQHRQPTEIDFPARRPMTVKDKIVELLLAETQPPEFYGNGREHVPLIASRLLDLEQQLSQFMSTRELDRLTGKRPSPGGRDQPAQPAGIRTRPEQQAETLPERGGNS